MAEIIDVDTAKREKSFRLLGRVVKIQLVIAVLAIVISIVVAILIIPLIKQKNHLESEIRQKSEALEKLKAELEETNRKLDTVAPLVDLTSEDITALKDLASGLEVKEPKGHSVTELFNESIKAIAELQKIKSTNKDNTHRSSVLIRYYPKRMDRDNVRKAMDILSKEYGFKIEPPGESREKDTPTNGICLINEGLVADDIKIIAFTLIRFGARLQYIGPYPDPKFVEKLTGKRVFVLGEHRVLTDPPLTVAQIRDMTLKQMWEGTRKLEPNSFAK